MSGKASDQSVVGKELVSFSVTGANFLAEPARHAFDLKVKNYATELLDEASRYEASHRAETSQVPQYTTAHISDAERIVRNRGIIAPPMPKYIIFARIAQYIMAIAVGVTSAFMTQNDPMLFSRGVWIAMFAACLTIGIAAIVVTVIYDSKGGRK